MHRQRTCDADHRPTGGRTDNAVAKGSEEARLRRDDDEGAAEQRQQQRVQALREQDDGSGLEAGHGGQYGAGDSDGGEASRARIARYQPSRQVRVASYERPHAATVERALPFLSSSPTMKSRERERERKRPSQ